MSKELDCVQAIRAGIQSELTAEGLTVAWRIFAFDDAPLADKEDRDYPAIEVYWMPLIPQGYRTTQDSSVAIIVRIVTHHLKDPKGVNLANIYKAARAAIDGYDFAGEFETLSSGALLVVGSDAGIEVNTRYIEMTLDFRVCG